jgi:hypothetical protein
MFFPTTRLAPGAPRQRTPCSSGMDATGIRLDGIRSQIFHAHHFGYSLPMPDSGDACVYFNNDVHGYAAQDAVDLRRYLRGI